MSICPNKHSIYAEEYPYAPRPDGMTRADQITAVLDTLGAAYVFPRDYLLAQKASTDLPLYYETDTHWNPLGASLAFRLVKAQLAALLPDAAFPDISYTTTVANSTTEGDLLPMLRLESAPSTRPSVLPTDGHNSDYYTYLKNDGRNGVHTKGADRQLPRALIFRDSFCTALEPFLSPLFSEAVYLWQDFTPADKAYVLQYKPDVIIVESVERYAAGRFSAW